MSSKAEHVQESRSSNEQSFEALNDLCQRSQQRRSRPSGSSDFENINDRKMEQVQIPEHDRQRHSQIEQQIDTLQKLLIKSEKSIQEQLVILKSQYQEREKDITALQAQNSQLKKKCCQHEESVRFYKEEYQKAKQKIQQQSNVSGSLPFSEIPQNFQNNSEKDLFKKKSPTLLSNFEDDLRQKVKENEFKIHSLQMKVQFFIEEDKKIRDFLNKTLKFNPSFPMQLSTMVQSAVIQLDSNLKEVNRQIENIILAQHLGNSNKILARREKMQEEKYNHWQVLSNLDIIKEYARESYKCK